MKRKKLRTKCFHKWKQLKETSNCLVEEDGLIGVDYAQAPLHDVTINATFKFPDIIYANVTPVPLQCADAEPDVADAHIYQPSPLLKPFTCTNIADITPQASKAYATQCIQTGAARDCCRSLVGKTVIPRSAYRSEVAGVSWNHRLNRWLVSWSEHGKQYNKYFKAEDINNTDSIHAAQLEAEGYRKHLEISGRVITRSAVKRSPCKGVSWNKNSKSWLAYWSEGSKQITKVFAVKHFLSEEDAKRHAIEFRAQKERELYVFKVHTC
eukprot:Platyproteum_vivax@DN6516_c0_g1_i1.p1